MKRVLKFVGNLFYLIVSLIVVITDSISMFAGEFGGFQWLSFPVCVILFIDSAISLKRIIKNDNKCPDL